MAQVPGASNTRQDRSGDNNAVVLSSGLHDEIRELAAVQWPEECCGLLIADQTTPNQINRVVAARNVAQDPLKTFEIDPQTLIDTYRSARVSGEVVVGCFHSHPNGNALPSNRDRDRADENGFLWMIVATDHTGALASGLYRVIHQGEQANPDDKMVRYFRRCKIAETA